tara:strand:- start:264 stop:482 length:219 start_codon:yes stop_codon:yes gene_type:complete
MKRLLLVFFSMGVFSCNKSNDNINVCVDESKIDLEGVCITVYEPVCGCDKITYSNSCKSQNAGVVSWVDGEC